MVSHYIGPYMSSFI